MYLRHLYPTPKMFSENESVQYRFGAKVTATVSGLNSEYAERVRTLWHRFSCDASELIIASGNAGFCFTIGSAVCTLNNEDTYALLADAAGVCVAARNAEGLMDGIKTLVQLICPVNLTEGNESFYISAADIHDAPAIGFRAIHICIFPGSKLYSIEQAIHLAGFLKLTHVILEFWGVFPYRAMPELAWKDRAFSRDKLKNLVLLARSYGLEVIPMFNHFGHATQSRSCNGRHVTLNRNPRLSRLFEPDGWTWCLSNPDTYKLLSDIRAELVEFCGPGKYFHVGFDEAYSFATCDLCRKREPHELLAEYLNRLTEDVCSTGRRPIIWHDELISSADFNNPTVVASGQNHNTENALELLDRRIIIADWQYFYKNGFNPTTSYFMEKGFDTVVCPWDEQENIRSLSADAKKMGAYGVILTTWHHLPNFLSNAGYWANCVWMENEHVPEAPITESACILRRLYDADGGFAESGWKVCEVEQ